MAEEGVRKQMKFEEEEEDRISNLQDWLLAEVLSLLPTTKHAIKTSTLSKRWKLVWPLVPNLIFIYQHGFDPDYLDDFFSSVGKTIAQCRHLSLKKFQLHSMYDKKFESQVNDFIRYAVKCNVEELDLKLRWCSFKLDETLFTNSCFTRLKFSLCDFEPIGAISWNKLRTLSLSGSILNEDVIKNILSGSPLLETFKLPYCHGYKRIDITSKSVKNLVFSRYNYDKRNPDVIEIKAPNILSIKVVGILGLRKVLLLDVSSLVKADLNFVVRPLDMLSPEPDQAEILKELILSLRHVKELKIGTLSSEALCCLKAKGFTIPSNTKYPDITQ